MSFRSRSKAAILLVCLPVLSVTAGRDVLQTVAELQSFIRSEPSGIRDFRLSATIQDTDTSPGGQIIVQDETGRIKITCANVPKPSPGETVLIAGETGVEPNYEYWISASNIVATGHGILKGTQTVRLSDLDENQHNLLPVSTEGTVIDMVADELDPTVTFLLLKDESTVLPVSLRRTDTPDDDTILGARVRVKGTFEHTVVGSRKFLGPVIQLRGKNDLTVLEPPPADPFETKPLEKTYYLTPREVFRMNRRKVEGVVLATWNRSRSMLREPNGRIVNIDLSHGTALPAIGMRIAAVGYPATDMFRIGLTKASWRALPGTPESDESPEFVPVEKIMRGDNGQTQIEDRYQGALVTVPGTVSAISPDDFNGARLSLDAGSLKVPVDVSACPDALNGLETGCRVAVTGRCLLETSSWTPFAVFPQITGIMILARSADDIQILSRPPWLTPARLLVVISILVAALIGFFVWNRLLARIIAVRSRQLYKAELTQAKTELRIDERTRLAVELHDSLSQNLTGVALEINTARRTAPNDLASSLVHLNRSEVALKSCRNELRNCLWDLRNNALGADTMNEAIRQTLAPHCGGVSLSVRFNASRRRLPDNTVHAILRIIRELVVNAIRHGKASSVKVAGSAEGERLLFSVRDDGCGFNPAAIPGIADGHFGLQGIRERLSNLNGSLHIDSAPGKGTRITVSLTLSESNYA